MTEEEIRPIAENYVEEYCHCSEGEYTDGSLVCAGIGTALIVSRQLEKQIAELEKENAELKAQLESERDLPAIAYMQGAEKQKKKNIDQLTKAKELLKRCYENYVYLEPLRSEIEQFLKENEK